MSQDIISDILNSIMNAKRAKKEFLVITRFSNLSVEILDMMKQYGYIDYEKSEGKIKIILKEINECRAIKPRYSVKTKKIEDYARRFLPARNFGYMIISTNKGLMTHSQAKESKAGGSIIAYFY